MKVAGRMLLEAQMEFAGAKLRASLVPLADFALGDPGEECMTHGAPKER